MTHTVIDNLELQSDELPLSALLLPQTLQPRYVLVILLLALSPYLKAKPQREVLPLRLQVLP